MARQPSGDGALLRILIPFWKIRAARRRRLCDFPRTKSRNGILHRGAKVREMAVRYFAESFSQDSTIMPLVIQAIERYGRDQAVSSFALREGLVQPRKP